MKKILIILMFLAAQVACAQNGWKKISYSDGNLAGNHTEAYEYKIDGVGRFFWGTQKMAIFNYFVILLPF